MTVEPGKSVVRFWLVEGSIKCQGFDTGSPLPTVFNQNHDHRITDDSGYSFKHDEGCFIILPL